MRMTRRDWLRSAVLAVTALAVLRRGTAAAGPAFGPVVFAAASLKTALDEVSGRWRGAAGTAARISYAASPALARQIEQGAPADIFISADLDWMDYLDERGLLRRSSRSNLLGNRIVLVAPRDSAARLAIAPGLPLAGLLGEGRLAMANTDAVPAGKYGKAALQSFGVWEQVRHKVAQAENVRAALLLVSRGEAPFGIVYETDAAADAGVRVLGRFPDGSHPPIVYPAALTAEGSHPEATGFLEFLHSPVARATFERQGFSVLE